MGRQGAATGEPGQSFLSVYDDALLHVYGYLLSRCGQVPLAEDLTAQTFLAAVQALRRDERPALSRAWLVTVARNKLVDHWRHQAVEERGLRLAVGGASEDDDPWDAQLDALQARTTLDRLGAHHRLALTLRYLDDLPVREVAALLHRSVHATEALLVRARVAFRRAYAAEANDA